MRGPPRRAAHRPTSVACRRYTSASEGGEVTSASAESWGVRTAETNRPSCVPRGVFISRPDEKIRAKTHPDLERREVQAIGSVAQKHLISPRPDVQRQIQPEIRRPDPTNDAPPEGTPQGVLAAVFVDGEAFAGDRQPGAHQFAVTLPAPD